MSRQTIRVIDLLCFALNSRGLPEQQEKREKIVAELRLLVDRLDERERKHLIKHNSDLDVQMRAIGVELPWWKNREDEDAADLSIQSR